MGERRHDRPVLEARMNVNVWVWPQLTLGPGADVTFDHYVVDNNGVSQIDPERWHWMSAVPDYDPQQHPDGPVDATGIEVVEQYAFRPYEYPIGADKTVWRVRWRVPSGSGLTYFRPRLM